MPDFRTGYPVCLCTINSGVSLPAGSNDVVWSGADEDPASQWDGASAIIVQRPGLFLLTWGLGRPSVASSSVAAGFARVNGANVSGDSTASTTIAVQMSGSRILRLEAGDQLVLNATFHTTLAVNIQALVTYLALARIGPVRWT